MALLTVVSGASLNPQKTHYLAMEGLYAHNRYVNRIF